MLQKQVKVINTVGIHARPASLLVQEANKYKCNIMLIKNEKQWNAKSILSVMAMGAKQHDEILITAEGENEIQAMESILKLIKGGFGEK
jgi:phosphocarrier protein HPr